ncbi:MAG: hypothetical protein KC656_32195, partial [Myxococcales bacterium]|nr:hypothetical protein [Myxococcales bacterium]
MKTTRWGAVCALAMMACGQEAPGGLELAEALDLAGEPLDPAEAAEPLVASEDGWVEGGDVTDLLLGRTALEGVWTGEEGTTVVFSALEGRFALSPPGDDLGLVLVELPSGIERPLRATDLPTWPATHVAAPGGTAFQASFDALSPGTTHVVLEELGAPQGWTAWAWDPVDVRALVAPTERTSPGLLSR